jgi:hypothetical protein
LREEMSFNARKKNMSIWKAVPGHEDYLVSVKGDVYSLKTELPFMMKQSDDGKGYRVVNIDNELTFVHRIVAAAFLGLDLSNPDQCVMHVDDEPSNNNLYNLRLGTQVDNIRDMYIKGRNAKPKAKVDHQIAQIIRQRRANGESGASLAKEYKISQSLICAIYTGKKWVM